jgi:hypothetical protein
MQPAMPQSGVVNGLGSVHLPGERTGHAEQGGDGPSSEDGHVEQQTEI